MSIRHFLTLHSVNLMVLEHPLRAPAAARGGGVVEHEGHVRRERRGVVRGEPGARECTALGNRHMVHQLMVRNIVSIRHFSTLHSVNKTLFDTT